MDYKNVFDELNNDSNKDKQKDLQKFFKTGKGEYGEGDLFIGVSVPTQRKIAKKYISLSLIDLQNLIESKYHECRLTSLFILVYKSQIKNCDDIQIKSYYEFYVKNMKYVNNWDLVDSSAEHIIGKYLYKCVQKNEILNILENLSQSDNLWVRRISMMSCFHFIKNNECDVALKICEKLLYDSHDLIHKAVGWMLREIGNRNIEVELKFLDKYYTKMPRTMLRYAIEKFDENRRKYYMKK
jgi:3-methyladenine DNA glycosylase AlkD